MIRYTGNPYVDAGVAVLELRLKKPTQEFTDEDLENQARALEAEYGKKVWKEIGVNYDKRMHLLEDRIAHNLNIMHPALHLI